MKIQVWRHKPTQMGKLQLWKYEPVPAKKGFVRFKEMCTIQELDYALIQYLKKQWSFQDGMTRIYDCFDYISPADLKPPLMIPELHRIYSNVCEGSSEGFYFHIYGEVPEGKDIPLFTLKTLQGVNVALELNYWITKFLLEEIE